jgi:hypothetical protein
VVLLSQPPAMANEASPGPASTEWSCIWIEGPTRVIDATQACLGVVHCRHRLLSTLVPQVRRVNCPPTAQQCDAVACFVRALRAPVVAP